MNSITNSPWMALDLAHAIQDEHLRRAAAATGRAPRRPKARGGKPLWWPTRPWATRPAALA
jgi:hypothetical protein